MSATRCAVCRHKLRADETITCQTCIDKLDDALADTLTLFALLPAVIEPGSVQLDDMPHGRQIDAPAPVRLEVLDMLDDRRAWSPAVDAPGDNRRGVVGLLESWATRMRQERRYSIPTGSPSVASEIGALRNNLAWIVEQDWVETFADEILKLHRDLEAVCGEPKAKPIGHCPEMVKREGSDELAPCGAPLFPPIYGETVTCERCKTSWPKDKWLLLGRKIEGISA